MCALRIITNNDKEGGVAERFVLKFAMLVQKNSWPMGSWNQPSLEIYLSVERVRLAGLKLYISEDLNCCPRRSQHQEIGSIFGPIST